MQLQLVKRRTFYALDTLKDSAVLSIKEFFPLFLSWGLALAMPILLMIIGVTAGGIFDKMQFGHPAWGTLVGLLVPGMLIGWFWAGWILVSLKVARKLPIKMQDLFRPLPQILSALVVLLLTSTLIGLGSILVIPGALLFLKWQLAPYYIVDRNYGPIKALKQSWNDTNTVFIPLALLDLILFGIHTLSVATLFGPIMVHMVAAVCTAIVYSKWLTDDHNPEILQLPDEEEEWKQSHHAT